MEKHPELVVGDERFVRRIKFFQKVVIRRDDGKILALRRSKTDRRRPGCWDLPGGNFEPKEEVRESVRREVEEETGLRVGVLRPIHIESAWVEELQADVIAVGYVAREFEGEVVLSEEHDEYRWVEVEEFLGLETGDDGGFLKRVVGNSRESLVE